MELLRVRPLSSSPLSYAVFAPTRLALFMKLRLKNLLINLRINSSGYHSIKGRTRLDGVELEKCGGEHGIR